MTAPTRKQKIVEEAESLISTNDFRAGHLRLQELNAEFRAAPRDASLDGELRARLKRATDAFYERRRGDAQRRAAGREMARKIKEQLLLEARSVSTWEDTVAANQEMSKLFERWRAAGSAGREHEDRLWTSFKQSRDAVRARMPRRSPGGGAVQPRNTESHRAYIERRIRGLEDAIARVQVQIWTLDSEIKNIEQALYYAGHGASQGQLRRMNNQIFKKDEIRKQKWQKLSLYSHELESLRRDLGGLP